jgi:hypothetical protein
MTKQTIQFAPRLASGSSRVRVYAAWPEDIKEGLRAIARLERKSMNWVIEQVIIRYFRLERPDYVKTKRDVRLRNAKVLLMVRKRA